MPIDARACVRELGLHGVGAIIMTTPGHLNAAFGMMARQGG
jgi:hypothetical protein